MHADQIQQLSTWLAATDIGALELRGPGTALHLHNRGGVVEVGEAAPASAVSMSIPASSVGVFLHRHPLRAESLAAPGQPVQAGQAVGLLQVGLLLLPVAAPTSGTVHQMLTDHGTVVGYGTPLISLHRPQAAQA